MSSSSFGLNGLLSLLSVVYLNSQVLKNGDLGATRPETDAYLKTILLFCLELKLRATFEQCNGLFS